MLESFASLLAAQLATELATRGVHAALLHEREIVNLREPIGALQGRTLPLDWDLSCISAMRL
jgi:hypothetical protein